jgi:ATP/maltotriose-dependent transcriptional regulator MalT
MAGRRACGLSIGRLRSTDAARRLREQAGLIREFLIQEILDPLNSTDRELLRRCSILNTLEPGLSESVTGMARQEQAR